MSIRSRIIGYTIGACLIFAWLEGKLDVVSFFVIVFVSILLNKTLGDDKPETKKTEPDADPEPTPRPDIMRLPPGQHIITTDGVKQVRNLLMKHHEMKRTDADYNASRMAKETQAMVAQLNVFLKNR